MGVENLILSSLKRVQNKRKRIKRKLNMKFFKSWATDMFRESGFKKGIRKLGTLHDCSSMGSCWSWRKRRQGRRLSWSDTILVSVYSSAVTRGEDEDENEEDDDDDEECDEAKGEYSDAEKEKNSEDEEEK